MSIEELLELPVDDIAKMSDDELLKYLGPYFQMSRPKKIPAGTNTAQFNEDNFSDEVRNALAAVRAGKPVIKITLPTNGKPTA